jgi:ADP-heptose:LPS heptosyltransferase
VAPPDFDSARNRQVLIDPNVSDIVRKRRWTPERFTGLIRQILAADVGLLVLITGGASERAGAKKISRRSARAR